MNKDIVGLGVLNFVLLVAVLVVVVGKEKRTEGLYPRS